MQISVLYQVGRVARLTGTLIDDTLTGSGLSGTDFAVYSFLAVHGAATVSEVAKSTGTQLPTTSKLLARAEELGHLQRRANPEDGRSTIVQLTESGVAAHADVRPDFGAALRRVNDALGDTFDDVTWALDRLSDALTAAIERTEAPAPAPWSDRRSLSYPGPPLSTGAEEAVRAYIEFVRWQEDQES